MLMSFCAAFARIRRLPKSPQYSLVVSLRPNGDVNNNNHNTNNYVYDSEFPFALGPGLVAGELNNHNKNNNHTYNNNNNNNNH